MSLRRTFMTGCLVAFLAGPAVAADKPEDAAQAAAESWLKLVDDGDYAASWEQAAKVFKGAVKQADWAQMVRWCAYPSWQAGVAQAEVARVHREDAGRA